MMARIDWPRPPPEEVETCRIRTRGDRPDEVDGVGGEIKFAGDGIRISEGE
jgi:hypothetical protein